MFSLRERVKAWLLNNLRRMSCPSCGFRPKAKRSAFCAECLAHELEENWGERFAKYENRDEKVA